MSEPEDDLAMAERHVREGELEVARVVDLLDRVERIGDEKLVAAIRETLAIFRRQLASSREHLRVERAARGLNPG